MFDVELDKQPSKFLRQCDKILFERFSEKIDNLVINPIPSDAIRIKGSDLLWRVRVGDYRMIYYIRYELQRIIISKIAHRSNVYDRLE